MIMLSAAAIIAPTLPIFLPITPTMLTMIAVNAAMVSIAIALLEVVQQVRAILAFKVAAVAAAVPVVANQQSGTTAALFAVTNGKLKIEVFAIPANLCGDKNSLASANFF
jgi:hypothetical protein